MGELTCTPPLMHTAGGVPVVLCSFAIDPVTLKNRLVRLGKRLGVKMYGVVVVNGPHGTDIDDPLWSVLRGTNTDLDFSGYVQGAEYLLNCKGLFPHAVLFVNDSLFTSHSAVANLMATMRLLPLLSDVQLPAIIGKADPYRTICHRNPWSGLDFYVSTYCFALNPAAISTILELGTWADADGLGHNIDIHAPDWGHGLQPAFREFLRANIVYSASPYAWHNLRRHEGDESLIRKKARCIYFEQRLSGELAVIGCILPTNAGPRAQMRLCVAELLSRIFRRFSDYN